MNGDKAPLTLEDLIDPQSTCSRQSKTRWSTVMRPLTVSPACISRITRSSSTRERAFPGISNANLNAERETPGLA
jgi:hypothetical protein